MISSETHDVVTSLEVEKRLVSVRCPQCLSAFNVDISMISNSKPEFDCVKCDTVFWFSLASAENLDTFIGFEKEEDAPNQTFKVKKSAAEQPSKLTLELKNTGKDSFVEDMTRSNLLASANMKDTWEEIILNFDDQNLHDRFLKLCLAEEGLEFAANKYGLIKKAVPGDEMSNRMIARIEGLATINAGVVEPAPQVGPIESNKIGMLRNIPWYYLIIASSLGLVLIGLTNPHFRNLVGVGVSLFFLSSAFKVLLR